MNRLPKIFIVDDEPISIELISRFLAKQGYPLVGTSQNASDALAGIAATDVDIVLVDVRLGGEDGIELASKINTISNAGVIFVTGMSDAETIDSALKYDFTYGIIYKPFKSHQLLSEIKFAHKRIQLQKQLLDKTKQIKSLYDASNDPMVIVDGASNVVIECNTSMQSNFSGLQPGENFEKITGFEINDLYLKLQKSGIKGISLSPAAKGDLKECSVIVCDRVLSEDKVLFHVVFSNHISGQSAFRRINLLESAINNSKDLVCVTDAELDLPGPIIQYVNPAFCEVTGFSQEELIGKTPRILQGPLTDRKMLKQLKQDLKAGKAFRGNTVNYKKDKTPYHVEWSIAPVKNSEGEVINFLSVQRDVTEKLQRERALELEKRRFQNIVEGTSAGTWEWDLETDEVEYNSEFAHILGYEIGELENNSAFMGKLAHPVDFEIVPKNIEAHLSGETKDFAHAVRMKSKTGEWVWCMFRGKVVERNKNGDPKKLAGILLDITEQKNAQIELERTKDFLDETNKVARVGGYDFDLESGQLIWSSVTREIHELPEDFVPDVDSAISFYKEGYSRDVIESELQRLITATEEASISCEVEIVTQKGNSKWVRVRGRSEFKNGKCVRIHGAIQDIDAQKKAALNIERITQFLEETNNVAQIGIWEVDVIKNTVYWSPITKQIHGVPNEFEPDLSTAINFYKEGESRDKITEAVNTLIETGNSYSLELQLIRYDGSEIWVKTKGEGDFVNGKCVRIWGVFQDINDQKQTEISLRQTKEFLEETNKVARVGGHEMNLVTGKIFLSQVTREILEFDDDFEINAETHLQLYKEGESREKILSAMQRIIEGETQLSAEVQVVTSSGKIKWVRIEGVGTYENGKCVRIHGAFHDIDESKQIQISLARRQKISEAIIKVRESILHNEDKSVYFAHLLDDIISITESEYGFIGDVLFDEESNPYLKTHALTNISWNEETRQLYEQSQGQGMEFRNLNTLFGEPMKTGKVIITNEPTKHPKKGGIPHGHPSLDAFMGVPIIHEGEMLAMFGIANRKDGYDETILSELQPLVETIGQIIDANNKEKLIRQKEEERKQTQYLLESFIDASEDLIVLKDHSGKYVLTNKAFRTYAGKREEDILGKTDFEVLPKEMAEQCKLSDDQVTATGKLNVTRETDQNGNILETSKFQVDLGNSKKGIGTIIRNVTHRVKMEMQIIENEARLKRLTDSFAGMLLTYHVFPDGSHEISYISKGVETLAGVTQDEALADAQQVWDQIHPEDVASVQKAVELSAVELVPFEAEWRFINHDKETWVNAIGNPVRVKDGSTRWYTLVLDVTEQKKLTQALKESEKKYREMIELLSEAVLVQDTNDKILDCNEAAARVLGLSKRQLMGLDSYHPQWRAVDEDGQPFKPENHPSMVTIRTGKPVRNRIMGVHKNENEFAWILVNSQPIFDDDSGQLKSVLVSFADFTEIKEAEKQIEESEKQYRFLFESNPLPMILFNQKTLNIIQVNDAATDKYEYSHDEFSSMSIKDIRPEEDLEKLTKVVKSASQGINHLGIWRHKKKSGEIIYVDINTYQVERENESLSLVVANDVTEKYWAEKKLEESEQKLNSIIQNATDAIITIDEHQHILMFNEAAEKVFGYTVDEILGKSLVGLMPAEKRKDHGASIKEFDRSNVTSRNMKSPGAIEGLRKNGEIFPMEAMISKVNVDGKVLFTAIVRDITERLEAERRILESHEFLRKLTDRVPGAVYQFEMTDDGKISFPYISRAITQLHPDLTVEQIESDPTTIFSQIHPDDIEAVNQSIAKSGEILEMWIHEYRVVYSNGEIHWHKGTAFPERSEGKIIWYGFVQETTDEVLNRQKLEESEKRFRIMADSAPVLIWISDTSKEVFYVNKQWTDFTGRTVKEELGNGWAERIHPDDYERCLHVYNTAFDNRESFSMEYRLLRHDNEYRWINDHGVPRFTESGEFMGYIGSCSDIHERVEVEELLEEQKEQLRTIIDNIPDCIYVKDRSFRKVLVNKAEVQYAGFTDEQDVLGKSDAELYGDYNGQKSDAIEEKILNEGYWYKDVEDLYVNSRGQKYHFLTTKVPLRNNKDEIVGIIGIGKDISQRKEMELRLAHQNQEFEAIFKAIPDLYFRISKEGVFVNCYAGQPGNLLLDPSQFIGKKLEEVLPENVYKPSYEAIASVLKTRQKYQFEYMLPQDGVDLFFEANYYALNESEVIAVVRNISDKKMAERSLSISEGRLKALIDSQTNFVLRTDMQGNYTYVNNMYQKEFGWVHGNSNLIGESAMLTIKEYDHNKVAQMVEKCAKNPGEVYQIEIDKPVKEDPTKARTTLWDFICLTDENGNPSEIQCMGIDISDRIEAQKALMASEARFRNMAENAPMYIAVHRKDYSSEYLNKAWREFFNLKGHDLPFEVVQDRLHPDELELSRDQFIANLDQRIPFQMEYRVRNNSGQYRWILNNITPVYDEKDEYNGFLSSATDITFIKEAELALVGDNERLEELVSERTHELQQLNRTLLSEIDFRKKLEKERRKAQEQLAETHRQLKSITENITEVVYRSTRDQLVYANPSMATTFGYSDLNELFQITVTDLYERPEQREEFLKFVTKNKSWSNKEMRFKRKDGSVFVGLISGAAIFDRQGQIQYIDGTIRDITDIKAAQIELSRKERDLTQAQMMAKLGNWTLTLTTDSERIVWDSVHYRSVGMDEIHPRPYSREFLSKIHPDDLGIIDLVAHDALDRGYSEFEIRMKEGEHIRYISGIIRKNVDTTAGESLFAVSRDVTREREAEMELEMARQKAEKLAEAKQQFLASMSHEIRTPINGIRGMTFLLQHSDLDNVQKTYVNSIHRSSDHLLGIVNEILDFSKLDSHKIEYESNDFELRDTINSVITMVDPKVKEKGLTLVQKVDDHIGQFVVGDSLRLSQILTNLLDNAIKFTEAGRISLEVNTKKEEKDKIWIEFKIEDTGIGIDKNRLEAIFDMFSQSDSSITRRYGGTGLGLAIVKKLCEQQGGTLEVISEPGEGSIFIFELPFGKSKVKAKRKESASNDEYRKGKKLPPMNILVVDDNATNRLWVNKVLHMWGATADEAENGKVALRKSMEIAYDAILMDIFMPEMDGLEATTRIRQINKHYKTIPIIGLTADVLNKDNNRYIDAGMDTCLGKPFNPQDLFNLLLSVTTTEADVSNQQATAESDSETESKSFFNFDKLDALADGDFVFRNRIIKEINNLLAESIPLLQKAVNGNDLEECRRLIHKLKPNTEYLGMTELYEKSHFFLQDLKKDNIKTWESARTQVEDIVRLLALAYTELQKIEAQNG